MLALALLTLPAIGACKRKDPQGASADGGVSSVQDAAPPPVAISAATAARIDAESGLEGRPITTSWSIASSNFEGQIADRLKKNDPAPEQQHFLVQLLLERAQVLANASDFEKAEAIGAQVVKSYPTSGTAHLTHAQALAALHKFDEASAELDEAAKLNGPGQDIAGSRVSILMAKGRYDEAAKLVAPIDERSSPIAMLTTAILDGRMQKTAEAERLFEKARTSFVDVSPFPIAWMDFERGMLLESQGKETAARAYYIEALQAIPVYVHAAVHLATTDPPDRAIARLEPLRTLTTDPDLLVALADAHRRAKHDAEAKKLTDQARARYDELVAKHPEAYRDHAARFFLGAGNDPRKALELAEKNARTRPTEEAIDLWMGTATAANDKTQICASAIAMKQLRWASEPRKRLAAAASNGCSDASTK